MLFSEHIKSFWGDIHIKWRPYIILIENCTFKNFGEITALNSDPISL